MSLLPKDQQSLSRKDKSDAIFLRDVTKIFPASRTSAQVAAVDGVSLGFPKGTFTTILGPSGCGKTTLLRMIAGFVTPTSGEIFLNNNLISHIPPHKRNLPMVFQNYALFPHLTVWQNIAYGLQLKKLDAKLMQQEIEDVLHLLDIKATAHRYPNQLSGGQQQRVALARALILKPEILLFDEPLSNLDAQLRLQMRKEIRNLQKRLNVTCIYVTHDQEEALTISDRIVVMHEGKIEQIGSPEDIYFRPCSCFVAEFLGEANFVNGELKKKEADYGFYFENGAHLTTPTGCFDSLKSVQESPYILMVRPEAVILDDSGPYRGKITEKTFLGSYRQYMVAALGTTLKINRPWGEQDQDLAIDAEIKFRLDVQGVQVLNG